MAANSPLKRSCRIVRLELGLSAEQVEMAKRAARLDAERHGGDASDWRGVLIGIAMNAIVQRLPTRAGVLDDES